MRPIPRHRIELEIVDSARAWARYERSWAEYLLVLDHHIRHGFSAYVPIWPRVVSR